MKKPSWSQKLESWIEKQIDKGTTSRILLLVLCTAVVVVAAAVILQAMGSENSFVVNLWNNSTTAINAWMPEIEEEEGGIPWGECIVTALVAIVGLFVTSTLIGIISSGIEERVAGINGGKHPLYIKDHVLILGYGAGTDRILEEVIRKADGAKKTVVVAEEMDRQELEEALALSVDIPENITLIGRNIDITETEALRCCSVTDAETVIIHPEEDGRVIKAVLAAEQLLKEEPQSRTRVVAGVRSRNRLLPAELLDSRILLTQTGGMIARLMAKCCLNPGLLRAMGGVFGLQGTGMYLEDGEALKKKTFGQLVSQMDGAVPMGLFRDGSRLLMPAAEERIRESDQVICFADRQSGFTLSAEENDRTPAEDLMKAVLARPRKVLIIGRNRKFGTLLMELPEEVQQVTYAAMDEEELAKAKEIADNAGASLKLRKENYYDGSKLSALAREADHIVLLSSLTATEGDPDADNIYLFYLLRQIRNTENLSFTVTVEFAEESIRSKAPDESYAEFIVESDITALMLSQAALNPGAVDLIRELTVRGQRTLAMIPWEVFDSSAGKISVRDLRKSAYSQGGILLGYLTKNGSSMKAVLNPSLEETVDPAEKKILVMLR